jgi:hypothetical protein
MIGSRNQRGSGQIGDHRLWMIAEGSPLPVTLISASAPATAPATDPIVGLCLHRVGVVAGGSTSAPTTNAKVKPVPVIDQQGQRLESAVVSLSAMVRVTSRQTLNCHMGVRVTLDAERATTRSVTVSDGFIDTSADPWLAKADERTLREEAASLTHAALRGATNALDEYEYRTGPLRIVLVKHLVHHDTSELSLREATGRAVREATRELGIRLVPQWVTFTPAGPRIRLSNLDLRRSSRGEADVTVELEPAAERSVTVVDGFIVAPEHARATVTAEKLAAEEQSAITMAHNALDRIEPYFGPLSVRLIRCSYDNPKGGPPDLDAGVFMALHLAAEQLELALAHHRGGQDEAAPTGPC